MALLRVSARVVYADRATWGALDIPRLGGPEDPRGPFALVPRENRTHAIHHHTVVLDDNDNTPNRWTSLVEVYGRMRQLQTIRPDLGNDTPYNDILFWMEASFGRADLVICEGRGPDRWGAHTKGIDANGEYHNGSGLALAFQGNTMLPLRLEGIVGLISAYWKWTVDGHMTREAFPHLGELRPVRASSYGHRDFRDENDRSTWTVCPGDGLYNQLPNIEVNGSDEDESEVENMKASVVVTTHPAASFIWATDWITRSYVTDIKFLERQVAAGRWSTVVEHFAAGTPEQRDFLKLERLRDVG